MKVPSFICLGMLAAWSPGCRSPGKTAPAGHLRDPFAYYGDARPVSSEAIQKLPDRLSLHELFTLWGFPGIGERGVGEYHTSFYDFRYEVGTTEDFRQEDDFDKKFDQIDVVSIWLVGGAPQEQWQLVWLSEKHIPATRITQSDIDAIPADASWSQVQSRFPLSNPPRATPFGDKVSIIYHRTPIDGYCFEFYFVRSERTKDAKLVSIYLSGGSRRMLKWGHLIDLRTGEIFVPTSNDPFAHEPIPNRFLQ